MMYQCLSDIPPAPSPADAENESDERAHDLISQQKEDGGDGYHDEDHGCGDGGFAPARPRDLLPLDAHLLQEFKRADLRHMPICRHVGRAVATYCAVRLCWPSRTTLGRSGGTRTPNPRFWRPVL